MFGQTYKSYHLCPIWCQFYFSGAQQYNNNNNSSSNDNNRNFILFFRAESGKSLNLLRKYASWTPKRPATIVCLLLTLHTKSSNVGLLAFSTEGR